MKALPWFRMYSRIMIDPKIEALAFEDQRHFVWLLCMKNEGYLDEKMSSDAKFSQMLCRKLGVHNDVLDQIKRRLIEEDLIDENWQPKNWDLLQFKSDCDTKSAERQKRFREKNKQKQNDKLFHDNSNSLRNVTSNEIVTLIDTDTNTNTNTNTDISFTNVKDCESFVRKNNKKQSPPPYQEILNLYAEHLPEMTEVYKLTDLRKTQIRKLWEDKDELPTLEAWEKYFKFIRGSPFLLGKISPTNGHKQFKGSIEFITNSTNYVKITERQFHDQGRKAR